MKQSRPGEKDQVKAYTTSFTPCIMPWLLGRVSVSWSWCVLQKWEGEVIIVMNQHSISRRIWNNISFYFNNLLLHEVIFNKSFRFRLLVSICRVLAVMRCFRVLLWLLTWELLRRLWPNHCHPPDVFRGASNTTLIKCSYSNMALHNSFVPI